MFLFQETYIEEIEERPQFENQVEKNYKEIFMNLPQQLLANKGER